MTHKSKPNFVQVNYDLLSTNKLNSTQKLFISYIIGWQKQKLICRETNNTLASRFGMKYSGIRTLINQLNKLNFFNAKCLDYNKESGTSFHTITVDEANLLLFLNGNINEIEITSSSQPSIDIEEEIHLNETEPEDNHSIKQYEDSDIINVEEMMTELGFDKTETNIFRAGIKSGEVTFERFTSYFGNLSIEQDRREDYNGLIISKDQIELLTKMIKDIN